MKKQERTDIVARADDAFGSSSYAEYTVEKKVEGTYKMQRFLMILAYIGIFAVIAALVALFNALSDGAFGMIPVVLFALAPLATWVLVHFTWGNVSVEYKYVIDHSMFNLYAVYGGKKEKLMFTCKMKDFELIAPYNDEYKAKAAEFNADQKVSGAPSLSASDIYVCLATDESGKKSEVLIQLTSHSIKAIKYYNKDALVEEKTLR